MNLGRIARVGGLALVALALVRCGEEAKPVPADVLTACRDAVSRYLIEPDDARFWDEAGVPHGDRWEVSGLVEGIRHRSYVCRATADGRVVEAHVS